MNEVTRGICWDSARLRPKQRCREAEAADPSRNHKVSQRERERGMTDEAKIAIARPEHHNGQWRQLWFCWGQGCGAVQLEQYSSTGGPDPNQPRNVEEEALGTMCSVPMPFWVPPASALFCFQAGENRKTDGLGPRSHSQLRGGCSGHCQHNPTTVILITLPIHISELCPHLMSVNSSRYMSGKQTVKTMLHCPLMVQTVTTQ